MANEPTPGPHPGEQGTIAVILPVFNEGANVRAEVEAIARVLRGRRHTIIVVDDGSTDGCVTALDEAAGGAGLEIVAHGTNQGLGKAIRSGLDRAQSLPEVGTVIMKDADMTQDPAAIAPLLAALEQAGAGIAIASRYVAGSTQRGVPPARRLLSSVGNGLFRLAVRRDVRDYTCNYRAFRRATLFGPGDDRVAPLITKDGFVSSIELLLNVMARDTRVVEVPFALDYRNKIGASKMRVGRNVAECLRLLLRYVAYGRADPRGARP